MVYIHKHCLCACAMAQLVFIWRVGRVGFLFLPCGYLEQILRLSSSAILNLHINFFLYQQKLQVCFFAGIIIETSCLSQEILSVSLFVCWCFCFVCLLVKLGKVSSFPSIVFVTDSKYRQGFALTGCCQF